MSEIQSQNNLQDEDSLFDFSSIINILIGKWYWFAISVFVFLSFACWKIYRTPKTFMRSATVLIKDSKVGIGANEALAFSDMMGLQGMSQSSTENEMLIMQSRGLMERVITNLGLHISYYKSEFLRDIEIYENVPFKIVESEQGTLFPAAFTIKILDENTFQYVSEDSVFTESFNKDIHFPFGYASVTTYPNRIGYFIGDEIQTYISNPKRLAVSYLGALNASLVSDLSSIVNVSFFSSRPGKAADVLNTLLDTYAQETIEDKNIVLENSQRFISDRLELIRQELGDIDRRIEGYKRTSLSTNLQSQSSLYLQNASTLEERKSNINVQVELINILAEFISKPNNRSEILPYNLGLENANLNRQIETYNENLIKMNRLIAASSERNPTVVDMATTLDVARTSIENTVKDLQKSLAIQQAEIRSRSAQTTGRIEAVSTNERNLQSIERDQKIKAELYLYLLNKAEENAIMKSMTEANSRVIDSAFGSDAPVSPNRKKILLMFFVIGLVLPAAYFILKDFFYSKVRGKSDILKVITAPILGEIPSKSPDKTAPIVVKASSADQVSEAFRILRTNMSFFNIGDTTQQVFAMTSSIPGEGKTYIAMNFGMTLAMTGKKVCLVDLDLRRHSMTKALGYKGAKGASEYLSKQSEDISGLIHTLKDVDNISILPAGSVPPNPSELLMTDQFDRMIAELRSKFDYVIIDNPPAFIVADAGIANRVADMTLFVIRAGVLDRRELPLVQDLYKSKKLKNMAVVLTDVNYERLYYSIGYKGYGKQYSYGYGNYNRYGKGYYTSEK